MAPHIHGECPQERRKRRRGIAPSDAIRRTRRHRIRCERLRRSNVPEGHSIHRYARCHREALLGRRVRVDSPQGRFAAGAARLDGSRLDHIEAHGKHLFYRWDGGDTLHVHLGLFGRFRTYRQSPPDPSDGTRLRMRTNGVAVHLSGPTACELIDPDAEARLRERLGPDPLRSTGGGEAFAAKLARRRIGIGAALLDQKVIAGIGNVYRAEILFLAGIHPHAPASSLTTDDAARIWTIAVDQLRQGERSGRIVTVDPAEVGVRRRGDIPRPDRLYVYKRHQLPCRRCHTPIATGELAARTTWWCPSCQS
jgi:formamidopyrimidine-DNA glycosylase